VMQQLIGIRAVMNYMPQMLSSAGFRESKTQLLISFAVSAAKFIFMVVAGSLVDLAGRRTLLMASYGGCMVALMMMGLGFTFCVPVLNVLGVFLYVTAFSFGVGPVTSLYPAEIFPSEVRARAMSLATAINQFVSFILLLTFLSFTEAVGPARVFWFYTGMAALCLAVVFLIAPETRGMGFEDVHAVFDELTDKKTCVPCLGLSRLPTLDKSEDGEDQMVSRLSEEVESLRAQLLEERKNNSVLKDYVEKMVVENHALQSRLKLAVSHKGLRRTESLALARRREDSK